MKRFQEKKKIPMKSVPFFLRHCFKLSTALTSVFIPNPMLPRGRATGYARRERNVYPFRPQRLAKMTYGLCSTSIRDSSFVLREVHVARSATPVLPSLTCDVQGAQQHHAPSMMYLGKMFLYGQGFPVDYDMALLWFEKAADKVKRRIRHAFPARRVSYVAVLLLRSTHTTLGTLRQERFA